MNGDIMRCPYIHGHLHVQYASSLKPVLVGTYIVATCEGPCMLCTLKYDECILWLNVPCTDYT